MQQEFSYWISADETRTVQKSHADDVVEHPSVFGLTEAEVKEVYDPQSEQGGTELVKRMVAKGWVRVRKYTVPFAYLSIVADDVQARADTIRSFIEQALSEGSVASDETVVLASITNGETMTYDSEEGGAKTALQEVFGSG
jgi:hypothetical protein